MIPRRATLTGSRVNSRALGNSPTRTLTDSLTRALTDSLTDLLTDRLTTFVRGSSARPKSLGAELMGRNSRGARQHGAPAFHRVEAATGYGSQKRSRPRG